MKQQPGRDFIVLTDVIASFQDSKFVRISDAGSTLTLSIADWEKLKKFVDLKIKGQE